PPAGLSGYVYSDLNDNGLRDSGDQPIAGTTITLTGNDDLGTSVNLTTMTAADGSYQFSNLRPGTYTLSETQPAGYLQGKDTIGSAGGVESIKDQFSSIPLTTGSSGNNYNFAEILPAGIAGFVYVDANNNGVMDPAEAGIANVTVTLTGTDDQANSLKQTTQTGANGAYAFGNLRPGVYAVTETPPISYNPGKIDVGSLGGTAGTNQIADIALGSGVHGTHYDFGHLQPTQQILASWFTIPDFSFGHPDLQVLSKLAFLSTSPAGGTDPVVKAEATYVDGLYRAILGRPADPNGLVALVTQLHNGLAPSLVVQDLWNSPEHRGLEVDSFYQNFLHRNADPAGRAYWVSAMLQGQSETDVEVQFLSSGEYLAAHTTNADYMAALYADVLGRDATSTEIGGWAQALQNGESRSAAARAFLTSSEMFRRSLEIDYRAYLMRAPDAAGEQGWLAALSSGQITLQLVTEAFFASGEFLALAQQASQG
ncbi:MAG TPA: SdrD B-like domain-containing protein, partial [Gemmataceae bacterium]|nr:SdrD B-like domain-containing protein [Gemmataceae bacterium]